MMRTMNATVPTGVSAVDVAVRRTAWVFGGELFRIVNVNLAGWEATIASVTRMPLCVPMLIVAIDGDHAKGVPL